MNWHLIKYGLLVMVLAIASLPAHAVDAGRFRVLHIKPPEGGQAAQSLGLAFVISDLPGWNAEAEAATETLARDGWLAVGLDLQKYRESLQRGTDTCHDVGDELISLSQQLQRERQLNAYLTPVIVGFGQGGVLAYAAIKQALPASFTAGLGIGMAGANGNRLDLPKTLCDGPPAKKAQGGYKYDMRQALGVPYTSAASAATIVTDLHRYQRSQSADTIADLPLVPMSPTAAATSDAFVIFISGDGGWRDLDKTIAEELHKQGIAVVGWDSLRYFWKRKTPEQLASDLGRVMKHYGQLWHKPRVALVGYSFGADAIPFAYNRLPTDLQDHVGMLGLLGLGQEASFEIEVEGYIGLDGDSDRPLAPELPRLPGAKLVCIYGEEDAEDSSCPALRQTPQAKVIITQGGHHFDDDYELVARELLSTLK